MNQRYHFKKIVKVAKNSSDDTQKFNKLFLNIGYLNGLSENDVNQILSKKPKRINPRHMTPESKLRYVHSLVQVIRNVNNDHKAELNLCFELVEWLGYDPAILNRLISKIYWEKSEMAQTENYPYHS